MSEWISVEERLPNDGEDVDVVSAWDSLDGCRMREVDCTFEGGRFFAWDDTGCEMIEVKRVEHWMPTPTLPSK